MNNFESTRMQRHLTTTLAEFTDDGGTAAPAEVLAAAARTALRRVGGVTWASITTSTATDKLHTAHSTHDIARAADQAQHRASHGPAAQAITNGEPYYLCDTRHAGHWIALGTALTRLNIYSVLALPLGETTEDGKPTAATLNLYANAAGAFSANSTLVATMLATHAGARWDTACHTARIDNLERALAHRATIGAAIGMLMVHHGIDHDEASRQLRTISHHSNRRVSTIAADIVETGAIPALAKPVTRIPTSRTSKTDAPAPHE